MSPPKPASLPDPTPPGVDTPEMVNAGQEGVSIPEGHVPSPDSTPEPIPADQVGDTVARQGEDHSVDTSAQVDTVPEGDKIEHGHVSEVELPESTTATAGDLRAAGYVVPPQIPDDEVPPNYMVDTPTPPGEIRPVQIPQTDSSRRLTPMQFIDETQGTPGPSEPSPTPEETTKEQGGIGTPTTTKEQRSGSE